MSKVMKKSSRFLTLSLCITLLITNALILSPAVGAASDTNETETETYDDNNISTADDEELTLRAIAVDEAKKEAQAVVDEQLALIAQEEEEAQQEEEEETEPPATEAVEPTEAEETAAPETDPAETEEETSAPEEESADSSSTSEEETTGDETESDGSQSAEPAEGYLMGIDNPDTSYTGAVVTMSDSDRDLCERMIMGEAGGCGFTGMALVAQCIRDTYVSGGYSSIADVLSQNGYYGSTDNTPSETCKEVVRYIFDQGGSAVQHRILVFYASDICQSDWHEAQNFVVAYGYVRFFDM